MSEKEDEIIVLQGSLNDRGQIQILCSNVDDMKYLLAVVHRAKYHVMEKRRNCARARELEKKEREKNVFNPGELL